MKVSESGYQAEMAAEFAGKRALMNFSMRLAKKRDLVRPPQLAASLMWPLGSGLRNQRSFTAGGAPG